MIPRLSVSFVTMFLMSLALGLSMLVRFVGLAGGLFIEDPNITGYFYLAASLALPVFAFVAAAEATRFRRELELTQLRLARRGEDPLARS